MKNTTLQNRLSKIDVNKNTVAYRMVLSAINGQTLLRPCYTQGTGRHITNQDHTYAVTNLLTRLGVNYETGNDSPRGGKTGNYVKLITKIEDANRNIL